MWLPIMYGERWVGWDLFRQVHSQTSPTVIAALKHMTMTPQMCGAFIFAHNGGTSRSKFRSVGAGCRSVRRIKVFFCCTTSDPFIWSVGATRGTMTFLQQSTSTPILWADPRKTDALYSRNYPNGSKMSTLKYSLVRLFWLRFSFYPAASISSLNRF